jgi:hypothetical protein
MKSPKYELEAVMKLLRRAYHEKENLEVGEQWQVNAMRRIRGLGPVNSKPNYFTPFEQFFWRLTPETCAFILILAGLLFALDFSPEYDVFTSLIYDTEEVTLAQLFGF